MAITEQGEKARITEQGTSLLKAIDYWRTVRSEVPHGNGMQAGFKMGVGV